MKRSLHYFLTTLALFTAMSSQAQTFDWWANNVHWDGVTSWKRYLIYSPGHMGPNALPVPEMANGSIDSITWVGSSGAFHFLKGDNTQNIKLNANILVAKDKVSIDFYYIPREWFQEDHATKTDRRVYYEYYDVKKVAGDAYANINFALMNKWRPKVQLLLRMGYRFPTSSAYGPARYTDAPAYYFDLSCAKPLAPNLKLAGMVGFHAYQTNSDVEYQNDAIVLGGGLEYNKNNTRLQFNVCTYYGYMRDRDDPMVLRLYYDKKFGKLGALLHLQKGIHDVHYTTVETGFRYYFEK